MVSKDVLEKMPVNGGEKGVQLVLFQQDGSVAQVKVCATLPGLKVGRLERVLGVGKREQQTRIILFKMFV